MSGFKQSGLIRIENNVVIQQGPLILKTDLGAIVFDKNQEVVEIEALGNVYLDHFDAQKQ